MCVGAEAGPETVPRVVQQFMRSERPIYTGNRKGRSYTDAAASRNLELCKVHYSEVKLKDMALFLANDQGPLRNDENLRFRLKSGLFVSDYLCLCQVEELFPASKELSTVTLAVGPSGWTSKKEGTICVGKATATASCFHVSKKRMQLDKSTGANVNVGAPQRFKFDRAEILIMWELEEHEAANQIASKQFRSAVEEMKKIATLRVLDKDESGDEEVDEDAPRGSTDPRVVELLNALEFERATIPKASK